MKYSERPVFPEKEAEQLEALKRDAQIKRWVDFGAERMKNAAYLHFCFVAPAADMNDPNGFPWREQTGLGFIQEAKNVRLKRQNFWKCERLRVCVPLCAECPGSRFAAAICGKNQASNPFYPYGRIY